jgi:hypothetical protein
MERSSLDENFAGHQSILSPHAGEIVSNLTDSGIRIDDCRRKLLGLETVKPAARNNILSDRKSRNNARTALESLCYRGSCLLLFPWQAMNHEQQALALSKLLMLF